MHQGGAYSCHEIENKKLLCTPDPFENGSEYEQSVHVEEYMPEISMHEHVRNQLPYMKIRGCGIKEGEIQNHVFPVQGYHYHHQNVDKYDILDLDSSSYSWITKEDGTKEKNPCFALDYLEAINDMRKCVDFLFVSTHEDIRSEMKRHCIKFITVCPKREAKDQWIERLKKRNPNDRIIPIMEENWDKFLDGLDLKSGDMIDSSDEKGKIVTSFESYLAIVLSSESAKKAEVGDTVRIDIGEDNLVKAEIIEIKKEKDDSRLIVFKMIDLSENILDYRKITVDVIWWSYSGLKVPNSSIIKEGDYSYVIRSREGYDSKILVKVLQSNDSYSLVDNYSSKELSDMGYSTDEIRNMYTIKLYDRIKLNVNK